nr:pH regulation protein F [Thermoanaerobacterales bacterium]
MEPARPGAGGLRHPEGPGGRRRGEGGGAAEEPAVINAAFVTLVLAALAFGYRLLAGPTLADRVVGLDGLLVVGVSAVALRAIATGEGAFLPVAVVVGLVGFVSTAVVGRYIEGRGR